MDIQANDNRNRILDMALSLFYEKGYDAVSVQNIVNSVGITKPTLYYYFGSKQGLLHAVVDENSRMILERLRADYIIEKDVKVTLTNVAKVFFQFALERPQFYYFMMTMMYSAKNSETYIAAKPWISQIYQELITIFDRWKSVLGNMNGRQDQFARSYFGFLNQYLYSIKEEIENGRIYTVDCKMIEGIIHQFMYGIVV